MLRLAIGLAISLAALKLFLTLTIDLTNNRLFWFDDLIMEPVFSIRSEGLTRLVKFITNLGGEITYGIIIFLVGIFLYTKKYSRARFFQAITILVSSAVLNILIKVLIARPRPPIELRLIEAGSYSFPSGHSMSAMAFYGFLFFLTIRFVKHGLLKVLGALTTIVLILMIGLSRVYLGVHYPSDVLAGFIAGFFWLVVCIMGFSTIRNHRKRQKTKL